MIEGTIARPATLVDWAMAPDLLGVAIAARLVGRTEADIWQVIEQGGVETIGDNGAVLIDKRSLREFWEIVCELGDYVPA